MGFQWSLVQGYSLTVEVSSFPDLIVVELRIISYILVGAVMSTALITTPIMKFPSAPVVMVSGCGSFSRVVETREYIFYRFRVVMIILENPTMMRATIMRLRMPPVKVRYSFYF